MTIAAALAQYTGFDLGIGASTQRRNVRSLRRILAVAGVDPARDLAFLTRVVALKYQRRAKARGATAAAINATLSAARCLFTNRALMLYDTSVEPAAVDDFRGVPLLPIAERRPTIPSDGAIAALHGKLMADAGAYRGFLLAAYCGLTVTELGAVTWGWIADGVLFVNGPECYGRNRRSRAVPIAADVLQRLAPAGEAWDRIAPPAALKSLRRYLRASGLGRDGIAALRRWFGAKVAALSGLLAAQALLGLCTAGYAKNLFERQAPQAAPLRLQAG